MLRTRTRQVARLFTAVLMGLAAGCAEPLTAPTSTDSVQPSLSLVDRDGNSLPGEYVWLDEIADGYTETWESDDASGEAEIVTPPGGFGGPTMLSGTPDPEPCDITIPGEMNTCPPQIIHGDGGGTGPPGGGNWWPPSLFPPPPPSPPCCGPGGGIGGDPGATPPPPAPPQGYPRVVVVGDHGRPNEEGYRAPKRVTIATPIVVTVKRGAGLVHFTVVNSTWERAYRQRTRDARKFGVVARYSLSYNNFEQIASSEPNARLVYVNNMAMISKLKVDDDGNWGGGFAQSSQPPGLMWIVK